MLFAVNWERGRCCPLMEKHMVRFWVGGKPADNTLLEALSSILAPPGFDRMLGAAYFDLCLGRRLALGPGVRAGTGTSKIRR